MPKHEHSNHSLCSTAHEQKLDRRSKYGSILVSRNTGDYNSGIRETITGREMVIA
jgi:hypothetical protein